MKAKSKTPLTKKQLLIGSTALATALAGSTAMAAGNGNPFASESTHAGTFQTAEMACGSGQCGSSMDDDKGEEEEKDGA
ncbi:MAG: hypothetical protein JXJ30_07635 [Halothiobacillaceae bacterium]|nr:hypothetical protein [Halothiobacillaceae bacterium]HER20185.1 hypothetical protein [Chromatiales bacterium]